MIYFDNSATTYPKPPAVARAVEYAIRELGGNPGRSGHSMSLKAARAVYSVRERVARFFGAQPENVVFTLNCTQALNLAIKGLLKSGDHVIISSLEHNSVSRPVFALSKKGVSVSVAPVYENDEQTVQAFKKLIKQETKAIICTAASNVTGKLLPIKEIAQLCNKRNIAFVVDAAQAAGVEAMKLSDGINIICTAGHKGLYGPVGTGLLITDGRYPLDTLIEGGTGTASLELLQPYEMPERLESGTVNTAGIVGLGKGIDFISAMGIDKIRRKEEELCAKFINGLSKIPNVIVYRREGKYAPIVAFNVNGVHSSETADYLSDAGFAMRGGYQCAALTHEYLKTEENGVVRFSPSVFNTNGQVEAVVEAIKKFAKTNKNPL